MTSRCARERGEHFSDYCCAEDAVQGEGGLRLLFRSFKMFMIFIRSTHIMSSFHCGGVQFGVGWKALSKPKKQETGNGG